MKKKSFNSGYSSGLFISASAMAFFLTSCCIPPGAQVGQKPCNCGDENQRIYAVKRNKPLPQTDAVPAAIQPAVTSSIEKSKNSQALVTEEPVMVSIDRVDAPMHGAVHAGQTFQQIAEFNTIDPGYESKTIDLLIPDRKAPEKISETNLPLGIKRISTSVIAGPNLSFKSSKEDYGNTQHKHKPGMGFQFGVGTNYTFSEKFAVSTSLLVKHNAASEVLTYSTGEPGANPNSQEHESKYSYTYLSAPILAEFRLANQLSAIAGPEINYLLGGSEKSSGNEKNSLTKNSVKVGVGAQLGLKYGIPGSPLDIQLLYDHRISRLNKKSGSDYPGYSYDTPAWKMQSVQLGVTCAICQLLKKNH